MTLLLSAPLILLLLGSGSLLGPAAGAAGCRSRIPPHDQVARVARFVAHQCDWASMATISTHAPLVGRPFSNLFSVSDGPRGASSGVPYLYLTRMEISVQDLKVDPRASLSMSLAQTDYCRQQGYDPQSPLCAHIILSGSVLEVNGTEADFAKKSLFSRHPEMIDWPVDHGWFFAKFNITQVLVLDYFGGVKTVTPEEYFQAAPHRHL
ncbi:protein CREG1 [Cololabis saira]|uniref:protein CREG1 n=1 Tax=Cololabis saira TaxID=129043 RepID=UPI002AD455B3|nr:protein CREG1 [Cololabis saira]